MRSPSNGGNLIKLWLAHNEVLAYRVNHVTNLNELRVSMHSRTYTPAEGATRLSVIFHSLACVCAHARTFLFVGNRAEEAESGGVQEDETDHRL